MRFLGTIYWEVWMGGDVVTSAVSKDKAPCLHASTCPSFCSLIKLSSALRRSRPANKQQKSFEIGWLRVICAVLTITVMCVQAYTITHIT